MSDSGESPLKELLVKEAQLNEFLLRDLLKPFISIEESSGSLIPTENFDKLTVKQKIVVVCLAQKAKLILKLSSSEKLRPKEIERILNVKGSTVRPQLKRLREGGIVQSDKEGYWVPNASLYKAKNLLLGGKK